MRFCLPFSVVPMNGFVYFQHVTQTMFLVYLNFFLMAATRKAMQMPPRLYKFGPLPSPSSSPSPTSIEEARALGKHLNFTLKAAQNIRIFSRFFALSLFKQNGGTVQSKQFATPLSIPAHPCRCLLFKAPMPCKRRS